MLKLTLLLGSALALSGIAVANAERTDSEEAQGDDAQPTDSEAPEHGLEPTDTNAQPLGAPTYWDIPSCHTYAWMKNHGTWLCAIHGEIQIMFDPRHQSCGKLYGSFWHQCAYQV
jgi:hypothetical protein